jgi:dihydrofolate synthase/folylpolyglutamate synthase
LSPSEEASALGWLYSLADQERGVGWNPRASPDEQWKLGRTRALLDLLGRPEARMRVVLVAGSKGKGSTCAMLASILSAHGTRVGLYTKPHLQSYRERVRVDGVAITPAEFAQAVDRLRRVIRELPAEAGEPTTFEVTTAMAIDYFLRARCEVAVVEVGLGGRLDATNALHPDLSVITPISYDHTAILGHTLGQIASEKAGIMRHDRVALLAAQRPAASIALRRACRDVGARCQVVPPLAVDVPLRGEHQRQNAALAIAAARCLVDVSGDAVAFGLERLRWPGRFEVVGDLVLDGAHNGASASALASTLPRYAAGRPVHLVLGINRDKDARGLLRPLLPLARSVWATQVADSRRALPAEMLARRCRQLGYLAEPREHLADALHAACAAEPHGIVCVTGSLALVGQARTVLAVPVAERLWPVD